MIRLAIIGPGRISHRFLRGTDHIENIKVSTFASRHPENVREYAEAEHIDVIETYEELYNDNNADAVYVSTPTFTHYEIIKKCLNAGKHVLSEKPLTLHSCEARELYDLAKSKGLTLMEAEKGLYLPVYDQIKAWLDDGVLGTIHAAEASYCRSGMPLTEETMNHLPKGGIVFDIGVYPLTELYALFPSHIDSFAYTREMLHGQIASATMIQCTADNILLTAKCSVSYTDDNSLVIYGDRGKIVCSNYWKGHDCTLYVNGKEPVCSHYDFDSEFAFQIRHFLNLVETGQCISDRNTDLLSCDVISTCERITEGH